MASRSFLILTAATLQAAVLAVLAAALLADEPLLPLTPEFGLLAAFVLLGELLPIHVERRHSYDRITVSTAFAFAILLMYGVGAAMLVYGITSIVADALQRVGGAKVIFNAAQYGLSMAAAAAAMSLAGTELPLTAVEDSLPGVFAGALTFFVFNQAIAGTGAALLIGAPLPRYLFDDLPFQAWTAGFLLALAPLVVTAAETSSLLVPVAFIPMMAIYFGGREAVANAYRATHDMLTDLPNRTLMEQRLEEELTLARRDGGERSLMIVDLDNFKAVNDTLGHGYGDRLLQEVAPRLAGALHKEDLIARLGGDEFAVLLRGGAGTSTALAERIVAELERPFALDSVSIDVSASIGIACFPAHGTRGPELVQHADVALYAAKGSPERWRVYDRDQDEHTPDRLALASQLRQGIERGELVVHYQPKFSLRPGPAVGIEALVRWNHPHLGMISPDGFIPLAEQTGVIKPLTAHVMDRAIAQCSEWSDGGLDLRVSVNVSPTGLLDRELPARVAALLERHSLPAHALQLEVTESGALTDVRVARTVLDELRATGVSIAIDDFGTGFSSLAQLQKLPVDEIKIDKSFVMDMERDSFDAAIVRSTIDLGRNLGLAVTAEGVESESVRAQLEELGCDFAQGFHLGRPLPAEDCVTHIRSLMGRPHPPLEAVA